MIIDGDNWVRRSRARSYYLSGIKQAIENICSCHEIILETKDNHAKRNWVEQAERLIIDLKTMLIECDWPLKKFKDHFTHVNALTFVMIRIDSLKTRPELILH
jgi:hypothetical protein